jgi:tRNA A-37 threonylcarbamoyl transferase component Bud32
LTASSVAVFDIPPGTVVAGRYVVVEKIADGAMATVYRATDDATGETVALKILDPLRGGDEVSRARFEREFVILSNLSHPGVARCYRLERAGGMDVLVLELVPGETLAARMTRGRVGVDEAVALAAALADALAHCHDAGVLHRDLKPTNIILHPERGPVILDFGVAWFTSAASLTRTGSVVGSPQYMAPEVFASSLYDARADLYALGAILFELLAGRPVHLSDNVVDLVASHQAAPPPSVATLRPEVGEGLAQVLDRAVAPRPEDRFATARELLAALRRGRPERRRELQARLPCPSCRTPLIIDLPFCPGCGRYVEWELTAGPYAVQLDEIADAERCEAWLRSRYAEALTTRPAWLRARLDMAPVPLIVNASQASAERLAAEARELGCSAKVIRARTVIGAKLDPSAARGREVLLASALHLGAVAAVGFALAAVGVDFAQLSALPAVLGLVGLIPARAYARRPLLRCDRGIASRARPWDTALLPVRERMGQLRTDRARHLVASAFVRAAPALLGEGAALASDSLADVLALLGRAVEAALVLDAQVAVLSTRSRSRLAEATASARARAARGAPEAEAALARLEDERRELTEASLAHDLAARQLLEICEAIAEAARTSTTDDEVRRAVTDQVWPAR